MRHLARGGARAGSVDGDAIYNTCYVFDQQGTQQAKHRKVHLFDIDVAGGQRFFESDTLSPGRQYTLVDTPFGKVGVAICFDVRFAELFRILALEGARLVVVPAAFNMTTGPAHWELLFRARALDNQCFVAAALRRGTRRRAMFPMRTRSCATRGDVYWHRHKQRPSC